MVAVRLEPMTEEQYVEYRAVAEGEYGRNIAGSGAMAVADARAPAAEDFARLLGFEVINVLMTKRLDGTPTGA